ncbi:hypothetical protein OB919_13760 [Halobacteria archaeon AArc-curdl1]|uniref:Glycerophosphoryl diester phosphodiesterase membrane domain-containing protein n=1 Tax=Natronosalvus hydrolyticus TaxID=2979988 RepID=A0AAP3E7K0_9EURY|nr:hypothetical protein [Halobacteria archaeon AArc-curdl1]
MAPLSVLEAIDDGFSRLSTREALVGLGVLFAVQLFMLVGLQSQLAAQRELLEETELPLGEEVAPEVLPLALDIPLGVSMILWLSMLVGGVTVSMVFFRMLAESPSMDGREDGSTDGRKQGPNDGREGEEHTSSNAPHSIDKTHQSGDSSAPSSTSSEVLSDWDSPATDDAENRSIAANPFEERASKGPTSRSVEGDGTLTWNESIGRTTLIGVGAAIIGTILVSVGLALFILPGLFLATALAFTHPYLATERVGIIEAMKRSFETTRESWLRTFALVGAIVLSFVTISSVGAMFVLALEAYPVVGELINVAFGALAWGYALAMLSSGFDQVRRYRATQAEKWDGIDDELLP